VRYNCVSRYRSGQWRILNAHGQSLEVDAFVHTFGVYSSSSRQKRGNRSERREKKLLSTRESVYVFQTDAGREVLLTYFFSKMCIYCISCDIKVSKVTRQLSNILSSDI
jgi:hypothetical protein